MTFRSAAPTVGILVVFLFTGNLHADDVQLGATFICNGERLYVENCNVRDLSDNGTCMAAHPDRPQKNGLMVYTYETRGSLKKLLPTCKQPSADEVRKANDFQRRQSQQLAANIKKANDELDDIDAKAEAAITGGHALSAEERQMYRCMLRDALLSFVRARFSRTFLPPPSTCCFRVRCTTVNPAGASLAVMKAKAGLLISTHVTPTLRALFLATSRLITRCPEE